VRLRSATLEDASDVHALERQLFGVDAWSARSVAEELTGQRRVALVACDPGVVGYLVTAAAGDVVDLQRVAVHPEHRRRGVARALLDAAVRKADAERMLLEVSELNQAALSFYAAEGFTEIDRRPRYYRDGSDAVVLELVLSGQDTAADADGTGG
jgi:[ribosomal protein S18]-alanine N-acetyltransferase